MFFVSTPLTFSAGIDRIDMFFNIKLFGNDVVSFCFFITYFYKFCSAATDFLGFWNIVIDLYPFNVGIQLFTATFASFIGFYEYIFFF